MTVPYPYLPSERTILYTPETDEYMAAAKECAREATDQHHPTGAVVVKDGVIVGKGHNWAPIAFSKFLRQTHTNWCLRKKFAVRSGQKYWLCPGCTTNEDHAESRAVRDAGESARGGDLYLWGHWWCCSVCWKNMMNAGIVNVYLLEGSEVLFNKDHPDNIIGHQFE